MGLYRNVNGVLEPVAGTPTNILNDLQDKTSDVINLYGTKNLIKYPYVDYVRGPVTNRGQTFTSNDDYSITVTGISTNVLSSYFVLNRRTFIKAGTYTLSAGSSKHAGLAIFLYDDKQGNDYTGTYSGLKSDSGVIYIHTTQSGNAFAVSNLYGYDKTFTIGKDCYVNIEVRGTTSDYTSDINEIVYPMFKPGSITDNDYFPPSSKTNSELVQLISERLYGDGSYNQVTIPTYGGSVRYIKKASVVTVVVENVGNTQNIAKGGYVQLGVELPSGYKPYYVSITGFGTASNSIGSGLMEFLIGSDGKMYVRSSEANITHGRAYATYVTV